MSELDKINGIPREGKGFREFLINTISTFNSLSKALEIIFLIQDEKQVVRFACYDNELLKIVEFCYGFNLHIEKSNFKVIVADKSKKLSEKAFVVPIDSEQEGMIFIYIAKNIDIAMRARMYEEMQDDVNLGVLLGYPKCCCDFFSKYKNVRSKLDNDYSKDTLNHSLDDKYLYYTNVYRRIDDLTLLSHFPCNLDCKESIEIGKRRMKLISSLSLSLAKHLKSGLMGKVNIGGRNLSFLDERISFSLHQEEKFGDGQNIISNK